MAALAKTSRPFRYTQCKPLPKKNYAFKAATEPSPTSFSIAASDSWLAAGYGSRGNISVLPIKSKQYVRNDAPPTVNAHGSDLADLAFSPFDANFLLTSGREGLVRGWAIPEGGLTENLSTPTVSFSDFEGGANALRFHPSASQVVAAGCKSKLSILDLAQGVERLSVRTEGFGKDVVSLAWNYDGSLLAMAGKNGVAHAFDPRAGVADVLSQAPKCSPIQKPQHVLFLGREQNSALAVFGLGSAQRPTVSFYDPRDLAKPLVTNTLDLSTGFTLPLYDPDTDLLFLSTRGSSTVTLFDVSASTSASAGKTVPGWQQIYQYTGDQPFKGAALQPKRVCNFIKSEVARLFTLGADQLQCYSFRVPRKIRGFYPELYPDTADAKAAQTAEAYFEGKDAQPLLVPVEKLAAEKGVSALSAAPAAAPSASAGSEGVERKVLKPSAAEAAKTHSEPASPPAYVSTAKRMSIDRSLHRSIFQHVAGTEPTSKDAMWFDLATGDSLPLCSNIAANSLFLAVPWKSVGGSALWVGRTDKTGRVTGQAPTVRGHKLPLSAFDLSTLNPHLLVTASHDGMVKLWDLPEGGLTANLSEAAGEINLEGKVTLARFHPHVDDLVAVAVSGSDGSFIHFYDITDRKAPQLRAQIKGHHTEHILDIAFDPSGKLIATADKGRIVRIFDPRDGKLVAEFEPVECERDTRVLFATPDRLVTAGFGASGRRSFSLWDMSKLDRPLVTEELSMSNATVIPHIDVDTGILFLAHNGSSLIDTYHIQEQAPYIESLNTFKSCSDVVGWAWAHKTRCNVKAVEVAFTFKLSKDFRVIPLTWRVPRKRLEFFQDDLFPPTRPLRALYTPAEWSAGADKTYQLVSLQPSGMTELSKAPKEELTVRQLRYKAQLEAKEAPKPKGHLGHTSAEEVAQHFRKVATEMPRGNRWDAAQEEGNDVDDSEWD